MEKKNSLNKNSAKIAPFKPKQFPTLLNSSSSNFFVTIIIIIRYCGAQAMVLMLVIVVLSIMVPQLQPWCSKYVLGAWSLTEIETVQKNAEKCAHPNRKLVNFC